MVLSCTSLVYYISQHLTLSVSVVFFLMIRRPPRSTRTDTLFPYTTLFRSNPSSFRPSNLRQACSSFTIFATEPVDLQRDALTAAGVDHRHLYSDKASGSRDDRAGLKACLAYMNAGDTLVVWKPDRPGPSLPHLHAHVTTPQERGNPYRPLNAKLEPPRPLVSINGTSTPTRLPVRATIAPA